MSLPIRFIRRLFSRKNRKRMLVVGAAVALCLVMLLSRAPEEPTPFSSLTISNPEVVSVGESFEVIVGQVPVGDEVHLTIDAGYGPRSVSTVASSDVVTFEVPSSDVAESGMVMLQATTVSSSGWSQLEVLPGEAVDPVDLYLGPRTVVADDEQYSMIVAVPTDRFGNPVASGTSVEFVHYTPSDLEVLLAVPTENLLAFTELQAGTKSGRSRIATTVGSASGQERTFNEVAGVTIPFTVQPVDRIPFADGASLLRIETSELVDRFGNQLPDGTSVLMTIDSDEFSRRLSGVTIDGVAVFTVEAPPGPVRFDVRAESGGSLGESFDLTFSPAVSDFVVSVDRVVADSGDEVTKVEVGPVITVDGAYIPNGTEVVVEHDGRRYETVAADGVASVIVEGVDGDASITILGHSETVRLGGRR